MSDNLFKKHSIEEIEQAVATALTELLGRNVFVQINALKTESPMAGVAEFSVSARHFGPPGTPDFGQPE